MSKLSLWKACCMTVLFGACACAQTLLTPAEVLGRMHKAYEAAGAYQDTGTVETEIGSATGDVKGATAFSIAYRKPSDLRVEWSTTLHLGQWEKADKRVLWSDGKETLLYWEAKNEIEKMQSEEMGIGVATGISSGAASTVPSMLLSQVKLKGFSLLADVKLLAEERIAETPCYVLAGTHPAGFEEKLWIGKEDFLLRKEQHEVKSSRALMQKLAERHPEMKVDVSAGPDVSIKSVETHTTIKVNQPIEDKDLARPAKQ